MDMFKKASLVYPYYFFNFEIFFKKMIKLFDLKTEKRPLSQKVERLISRQKGHSKSEVGESNITKGRKRQSYRVEASATQSVSIHNPKSLSLRWCKKISDFDEFKLPS